MRAGYATERVTEWKDSDSFYAMPDWLAPLWEKATHIVVQYSGGKDSTGAALFASHHRGVKDFQLCFSDPGVEFPGISAHVAAVADHLGGEPLILKPERDWWAWLREQGSWPSLLYRPCAMEFVHKPFAAHVRKLPESTTILLTGSRAEEAVRGSTKTERSPLSSLGAKAEAYQHFAPCFSVKKDTLTQLIEASGVPVWEGYSRGFVRTACWCCPGQCGEQALALQKNYPGLADDIRRWEGRIGPIRPHEQPQRSFDDVLRAGEKRAAKAEVG